MLRSFEGKAGSAGAWVIELARERLALGWLWRGRRVCDFTFL